MDNLLDFLKESYQDLSEELDAIKELEDALNDTADDNIEDPVDFPVETPIEKSISELPPIKSTVTTPPPRPERKIPTKKEPVKVSNKVATPQRTSTNTAQTEPKPTKKLPEVPNTQVTPNATPTVPSTVPVINSNNIMKRLLALKATGKTFDTPLKSRALSHMSYDPNKETLKVTFTKNGRTYLYRNVNLNKARMLIASNHKGSLFNRAIKKDSPYQEI